MKSDQDLNPGLSDPKACALLTLLHHRECVRVSVKKTGKVLENREEEAKALKMNLKSGPQLAQQTSRAHSSVPSPSAGS